RYLQAVGTQYEPVGSECEPAPDDVCKPARGYVRATTAMDFYLARRRALQHAFALCALLLIALLALTGCTIVEGIFKAGVWVGVVLVVGVIVLLVWLLSKIMG